VGYSGIIHPPATSHSQTWVKRMDTHDRSGRASRTLLWLLPLVLLAGAVFYYYLWKEARIEAWRQGENAANYKTVREEFLTHLRAGQIDQALTLTSRRFQLSTSRDRLAQLAKKLVELEGEKQSDHFGEGAGQSGPPSGDPGNIEHQRMEFHQEYSYRDGKTIMITMQVRREKDSLLLLHAPPFVVDVFDIEEKTGKPPQQ